MKILHRERAVEQICLIIFLVSMAAGVMRGSRAESIQTYIVHLSETETEGILHSDRRQRHSSLLGRVTGDLAGSRILYSYESVINGFSARLSENEILALQSVEGFVAAYPDRLLNLQTTYSYRFLQLDSLVGKLWPASGFGEGSIIGVLDTGIWPESPSFRDDGMPDVPERWRGGCQSGPRDFNASHCNKKLIPKIASKPSHNHHRLKLGWHKDTWSWLNYWGIMEETVLGEKNSNQNLRRKCSVIKS
jgi:hypothetical protein